LETSGKLSVILKPEKQPVLKQELNITVLSKGLPISLITDGHVSRQNLAKAKVSEDWLLEQIKQQGYNNFDEVFFFFFF
jgi:uncharacterized membrane protein YcaP (DUF421 family)